MIVSSNRVRAPGLRHVRTPPPAHARSRAPAPPACEHPASPRPHPAASSRSLTRSRSTCVRTPSVATPAPRRQLTLAHALPLHLRANTQRPHARTPPPTYARSRAPAPPTRDHPPSQRPHPPANLRSLTRTRSTGARPPTRTTPHSLARSRAPAPPACEHPASPRPHPAASSRSLTRSRSTCARTPSVTTPAPRRNLTLAHALTLAVPGTPDVASSRSLISSPGASARHAPRSRGSRTSRRASPSRFEPNTARLIAIPGKSTRWGAFCAYSAAETESMRPHDGYGSGTPSPRNDSVASTRIALPS